MNANPVVFNDNCNHLDHFTYKMKAHKAQSLLNVYVLGNNCSLIFFVPYNIKRKMQ